MVDSLARLVERTRWGDMAAHEVLDTDSDEVDERRVQRREARRRQLLASAIEAIRSIGPGVTMEQLAKAGGVTKPILYRHFGDRDGLITAIAHEFSTDLVSSITGPLQASEYPREMLNSTVGAYVAYLERDPYLYGFLIQQSSPRHDERTPISSLVDVVAQQVAAVASEQLRTTGRSDRVAIPWAYGIVGLVHQATNWWLRDHSMSQEDFLASITELMWTGLAGVEGDVSALDVSYIPALVTATTPDPDADAR
jgi:AcrR family transcriptional regulator